MNYSKVEIPHLQSGFTLIELMIVVAIAGIVTMVALPSLTNTALNQDLKAAATDMHLHFLLARSEAIKRNEGVEVVQSAGGWTVQIADDDTLLQTKSDLDSDISVECNIDSDVTAETCPTDLTFNRTGRATCTGCSTFEIRFFYNGEAGARMRCVGLSLSGRPRIAIDTDGVTSNGCS